MMEHVDDVHRVCEEIELLRLGRIRTRKTMLFYVNLIVFLLCSLDRTVSLLSVAVSSGRVVVNPPPIFESQNKVTPHTILFFSLNEGHIILYSYQHMVAGA